jgi:hypothetical protein
MKSQRRIVTATAAMLALAASLMLASAASAHDRNRDRIPDRWERAHHLSLHVNQARRDQDHDGLNNRGEFRAHLNPRDADTDDDGIDDGDENAGTVASFAGGVLTITLAGGGTLTANVTDDTEIECPPSATASHDGGDDDHEGDDQGDDPGDDDDEGDDDHHGDCHHGSECGTDALTTGAVVREAELKTQGGNAVWEEIKLG